MHVSQQASKQASKAIEPSSTMADWQIQKQTNEIIL